MSMEPYDPNTDAYDDSETMTINMDIGEEVVCLMGEVKGERGKLVANRDGGRILVRLAMGLYLELPRFCVERYRT